MLTGDAPSSQIPFTELAEFSEVFAAGTAAVLVPVRSIEHRSSEQKFHYRDGKKDQGSCYTRLFQALKGIQQGKIPDSFGWTEVVRDPYHQMPEAHGKEESVTAS